MWKHSRPPGTYAIIPHLFFYEIVSPKVLLIPSALKADGSGDGMAVPAVLHEIHCLRTIREYFFPEHYPVTAARYPHAPGELNVHVDHCIDG